MKKLMYKIMLTCKQATYYSSIRSFKKLSLMRRIQLKLHLLMCDACHDFDHQSQIIDQTLINLHQNKNLQSEETLPQTKTQQIKEAVDKTIK